MYRPILHDGLLHTLEACCNLQRLHSSLIIPKDPGHFPQHSVQVFQGWYAASVPVYYMCTDNGARPAVQNQPFHTDQPGKTIQGTDINDQSKEAPG